MIINLDITKMLSTADPLTFLFHDLMCVCVCVYVCVCVQVITCGSLPNHLQVESSITHLQTCTMQ